MSYQEEPREPAITRLAPAGHRVSWRARSSLPAPLTSFVGRDREVAALTARLAETRLLTLTGIGGIGKSRLALEVARRVETAGAEPVCLIELAAVAEPNGVVAAIASALGVQQHGDRPLLEGVVASLADRDTLLILDNCEHLVDTVAAQTLDLLRRCPALRVLATSRTPLQLDGETIWRVEPLTVPDPARLPSPSALLHYPAVQLFVDRARTARSAFHLTEENAQDVVRICTRLDGIPLAIELAAARVNVLNPGEIVRRLDDRFRLLTSESRTALPHHRTLRALIDWSCDLLDARERILLRRLAVFAGGWTLAAAEHVCGEQPIVGRSEAGPASERLLLDDVLDLLSRLVSKSLVQTDHEHGETRFGLLETIREYALGLLRDAGEEHQIRQRHLDWVVSLAEQAHAGLWTFEQGHWLERLDAELENVRAALTWSAGPGDAASGLRITARLWRFWEQRGLGREARARLSTLLDQPAVSPGPTRALALALDGYVAHLMGDLSAAGPRTEEALAIARAGGDPVVLIYTLMTHAVLIGSGGDVAGAKAEIEEGLSVSREAEWDPGIRMALVNLSIVARISGAEDRAAALLEEGRARAEAAGDRYTEAFCLTNLAHLAYQRGASDLAEQQYRQALAHWRDLRDTHNAAMALEGLAWAVGAQQHAERAARLFGAAEALRERVGTALLPHWQADHDRARATAQAEIGERAFATAHAEGRAMTAEQAIAFGLTTLDDGRPGQGRGSAGRTTGARRGAAPTALSSRETQVARLVARGLTNRQIAETLFLQPSTVGNHLQRIYARLELRGRAQLVAWLAAHDKDGAAHLTASVSESDP